MDEKDTKRIEVAISATWPDQYLSDENIRAWAGLLRVAAFGIEDVLRGLVELANIPKPDRWRLGYEELRRAADRAQRANQRTTAIHQTDDRLRQLPARTTTNPAYPRAAAAVARWVAAETAAGRAPTEATIAAAMERELRPGEGHPSAGELGRKAGE